MSPPSLAGVRIVFDLDGTLVDTAPDLIGALNVVLEECGLPARPQSAARVLVGRGARVLIAHGFEAAGVALDDAHVSPLVARFIEVYSDRIARESRAFPNAVATLKRLSDAGAICAVCTNKPGALARSLAGALQLSSWFAAVVGPDDAGFAKPDPRHLLYTLAAMGSSPSAPAVMIGDSAADVGAARAAGLPVIVTRFGYTATAPEELGGDALIDDLAEVPGCVARLLVGLLPTPSDDIATAF